VIGRQEKYGPRFFLAMAVSIISSISAAPGNWQACGIQFSQSK
jgi:hypothetical protein